MKECFTCKEIKLEVDFPKNSLNRSGLHSYCRVCTSAKNRRDYRKHREKILERAKQNYLNPTFRERVKKNCRNYYLTVTKPRRALVTS